jgi:hypothetical protein
VTGIAEVVPCAADESVMRTGPCNAPVARQAEIWVLAATILGSGMAWIDATAVNVALPTMQRDLHATAADMQWVIEDYSLFLAALILVGGSGLETVVSRGETAPGIAVVIRRFRRNVEDLTGTTARCKVGS